MNELALDLILAPLCWGIFMSLGAGIVLTIFCLLTQKNR